MGRFSTASFVQSFYIFKFGYIKGLCFCCPNQARQWGNFVNQTNQVDLSNIRDGSLWRVMFCVNVLAQIVERKVEKRDPLNRDDVNLVCEATDQEARRIHQLEEIKLNAGGIDLEMEPGSWRTTVEWKQVCKDLTDKVLGSRQRRLDGPIPPMQLDRLKQLADSIYMYEHAASECGVGGHPNEILEEGDRGSVLDELGRIMEDIKLL